MSVIDNFLEYTKGLPSPDTFKLWGGILLVSSALGRNTWVNLRLQTYPNLFCILVSPPGGGKSLVIKNVKEILQEANFKIAPDDITRAALIDHFQNNSPLARPPEIALTPEQAQHDDFSSGLMIVEEFSLVLMKKEENFPTMFNIIWDCPEQYEERRRSRKDQFLKIVKPHMCILTGMPIRLCKIHFPDEIWGSGFTARSIFVYEKEFPPTSIFDDVQVTPSTKDTLVKSVCELSKMYGQFTFTKEARQEVVNWINDGREPLPIHLKLQDYNVRRDVQVLKLAQISAASRFSMEITGDDVKNALRWLFAAEKNLVFFIEDMYKTETESILDILLQVVKRRGESITLIDMNRILMKAVPLHEMDMYKKILINHGYISPHPKKELYIINKQALETKGKKDVGSVVTTG